MKTLSMRAILTLSGQEWLDDEIIDFFIEQIIEESGFKQQTLALRSTFYVQLLSGAPSSNKYRRIMNSVVENLKNETVFSHEMIILPICEQAHWIMLILLIPNITIYDIKVKIKYIQYNSLGYNISNEILDNIRTYLSYRLTYELGTECHIELNNLWLELPIQTDNNSCGIYIIHFLEKTLQNRTELINISQNDYSTMWAFNPVKKRTDLLKKLLQLKRLGQIHIPKAENEDEILSNINNMLN